MAGTVTSVTRLGLYVVEVDDDGTRRRSIVYDDLISSVIPDGNNVVTQIFRRVSDGVLLVTYTDSNGDEQTMEIPLSAGGGVDTSGTPVANDIARFTDADTIEGRSYAELRSDINVADGADVTGSNSPQAHSIASHNDTTGTGTELDTLTDNSMADALHRHSELSASDGTPDKIVYCDTDGILYADAAPKGLDILYSAEIGTHLTVGNNIIVSGTVDGVDIAARDHAKYLDTEAVSAVEAAGLTFAENKGIILDALLSGDEKYSGITEIGTMGYGATVGDLIYLAVADTKWELAKADVAATSKGKIGLVLATTSENSTCQVLLYGKMRSAAFPTLTVGAPVHISAATAGDIAVAAPTGTTNFVVRSIGYGNTAEDLYFYPDNSYVELA